MISAFGSRSAIDTILFLAVNDLQLPDTTNIKALQLSHSLLSPIIIFLDITLSP